MDVVLGGRPIGGNYRLIAELGRGGMADVYLAVTEATLGGFRKLVVVKILRSSLAEDEDVLKMFLDEARLAARLNHPNVVQTNEVGEYDGQYFIAMEYLEGQTYSRVTRRLNGDRLPLSIRLHVLKQALSGLHYAHELNDYDGTHLRVVHRDVTPSNVFVTYDGQIKLLDFGIAKALDSSTETRAGVLKGKVGYMAPEQMGAASPIDRRTDVYSAGVVLWEMLTGTRMWKGIKPSEAMGRVLRGEVPRPSEANPDVAPELEAICMHALAYLPDDRYATATELEAELDKYLEANPPRPSDREIGSLMIDSFTDDRARMRAVIEAQLAAPGPSQSPLPDLSELGGPHRSSMPPALRSGDTEPTEQARPVALNPTSSWPVPSRWRSAALVGAGATAAVVALALGAGVLGRRGTAAQPAAAAHPPSSGGGGSPSNVRGITDTQIRVGMSAAFSGPARELGERMKLGVDTAFSAINDEGGVNGRTLTLFALDDGYDAKRAGENVAELIDGRSVFALVGNVGTPTAQVTLPYAVGKKTIFFGAFTGAKLLRQEPPDRYVFNYRASYEEETAKMIHYLVEAKRVPPENIVVFAQHDSYGDAGFSGVAKTLRKYGRADSDTLRVNYERNTTDVDTAVNEVVRYHNAVEAVRQGEGTVFRPRHRVKAVVMISTYKAAARFIQRIRDLRLEPYFLNVSFVGSNALAEELKELGPTYSQGVIVTQVVPHYESGGTGVIRYREALNKFHPEQEPDFVSLEGYFVGRLFGEGLRRCSRQCDSEKLVESIESIDSLDIGTGAPLSFGPSQHQASHKVWGTILNEQWHFVPLDMD